MNKIRKFVSSHLKPAHYLYILAVLFIATGVWIALDRKSSDGLPESDTPADTGALHISLLPTAECLPFYVAEATGIFDSIGLKIVITDRHAQFDADTAIYGHSTHLAATDLVRLQYQATRGNKATILMGLQGKWGIAAAPGQRATDIKALKDRLLGMSRYSASDLFGARALRDADMDYNDLLRAQANEFRVRTNMVAQAQMEAAVLPEPWLSGAAMQGARTIWQLPESESTLGCLAAQPSILTSKRRSAQVQLMFNGYDIAVKQINRQGLKGCDTIIARHYDIPIEVLQKIKLPHYKRAALPPATAIERSRTFLTQRGVTLVGSILMDDRFIKK